MTNQNDSFIDEVTEDLRRDRLFILLRRWGWLIALVIVGIVGASAWREYSRNQADKRAQSWGDTILAAEGANSDPAARSAALAGIDPQGSAGREAITALLAADAAAEAGDIAGAVKLYDKAAAAAGADVSLHDMARLKSVITQGAAMDAAARDAALADLAKPGAPYEMLALEQQAIALAEAGRKDDAITLIRQIQPKDNQSNALRRRLSEFLIALGAEPALQDDETPATGAAPHSPEAGATPTAPTAPIAEADAAPAKPAAP